MRTIFTRSPVGWFKLWNGECKIHRWSRSSSTLVHDVVPGTCSFHAQNMWEIDKGRQIRSCEVWWTLKAGKNLIPFVHTCSFVTIHGEINNHLLMLGSGLLSLGAKTAAAYEEALRAIGNRILATMDRPAKNNWPDIHVRYFYFYLTQAIWRRV